jgi:hypothetical protein
MKQHFCPAEQSMIAFENECNWCGEQETSMIEVLKQALSAANLNERHQTIAESYYWLRQYKLLAEKAIAKLENSLILTSKVNISNNFKQPQRTERNFCSRCGKRTADLTTIHTCTPPQD